MTPSPHQRTDPTAPADAPAVLRAWLESAAARRRLHLRLREIARVSCAALGAAVLYLALKATHLAPPVVIALLPLLLLAVGGAAVLAALRCARPLDLAAAAKLADRRARLEDELTSAYWFTQRETRSPLVATMLRRASWTVGRLDLHELFPLRLRTELALAAGLATLVVGCALTGRAPPQSLGAADAALSDSRPRIGRAPGGAESMPSGHQAAAGAAATQDRFGEAPPRKGDTLLGQSAGAAESEHAAARPNATGTHDLLDPALAGPSTARAQADAWSQVKEVSDEVAEGILDRIQALLGEGTDPKPGGDHTTDTQLGPSAAQDAAAADTQSRDAEQQATMDALSDALRALSQAPTGDQPSGGNPAADGSQNNGRANINGGAMGMRVDTSQAGAGGEDTPPDAPSEGLGESLLGKPTLRAAARLRLQRVAGSGAQREDPAGVAESFYAATQFQAARLELSPRQAAPRATTEAALAREQLPVAYRSAVKRYFLTEHGKER